MQRSVLFVLLMTLNGAVGQFSVPTLRSQLLAAPPGTVFQIPPGTHLVDAPIQVPSGVSLLGAGIDDTVLLLDRSNAAKFSYGFVVSPAKAGSIGAYVGGFTIDGNRSPTSTNTSTMASNTGGGLSVGSSWMVENVRFSNINYFKLWARNVSNVVVRGLVFEDLNGTTSGGNDNIGGGRIDGMVIDSCVVKPNSMGNGLDLMRSRNISVINSKFLGSPQRSHNVYYEAVVDSVLLNNQLQYSSISIQSDVSYSDTVIAVNPRGITVRNNTISDALVQGVSIKYDNGTAGGNNTITGNTVERSGTSGIVTMAFAAGLLTTPDTVQGNTIINPFKRGTLEWNTGYGITSAVGVTLGVGPVNAGHNTITSSNMTLRAGTQVALRSSRRIAVSVEWVGDDTVTGATSMRYYQPV
jgi:hypothetical protein